MEKYTLVRQATSLFWKILPLFLFFPVLLSAQPNPSGLRVIFMEPDTLHGADSLSSYRVISDTAQLHKYRQWLGNDPVRWAFDLYRRAWDIEQKYDPALPPEPVYYIAIIDGGNHATVGFRLNDEAEVKVFPYAPYIKLAPEDWVFNTTLLHETGHMILAMLNRGESIPKKEIAPIPHTTAALTDRGTAFDEGFAIHLETLAAHFLDDPVVRERYGHGHFMFGVSTTQGEYHRAAADLLTFAQTRARYLEVRENYFAFAPAFQGSDYIRVEMEKARDFATVRDANQLLQSEGFTASFFFNFLVRGDSSVPQGVVVERQTKVLETLGAMFAAGRLDADAPFLVTFVQQYMKQYPGEAKEALDVLLDLSHGVFVDREAPKLWRDHYLGSLRLDLTEKNNKTLEAARDRWRSEALKNPAILLSFVGPQIRCETPELQVKLVAFEESAPLSFDINTVEDGVMRMIPGITESEVEKWLKQRGMKFFVNEKEFKQRGILKEDCLKHLRFVAN